MSIQIKEKAPSFTNLQGTDQKSHALQDFTQKLLVIVFSCNHCPYVKAYEARYKQIQSDYASKDVQMIAINSNDAVKYPDDSFDHMVKRADELAYNFPYLHDSDQSVAKAYGASNTPHVFVLDENRDVRYVGRIDDNWEDESAVRSHDLRNVLDDLLAGNEPRITSTLPVGCSIKWK